MGLRYRSFLKERADVVDPQRGLLQRREMTAMRHGSEVDDVESRLGSLAGGFGVRIRPVWHADRTAVGNAPHPVGAATRPLGCTNGEAGSGPPSMCRLS